MGFKDELREFEPEVKTLQNLREPEIITDDEAVVAINVLNYAKFNKVPDLFLGCAAYNLLNAYTKQKENRLSCHFHRFIHEILKGIEDVNQPKTIKVSYDNTEKLRLLIISFWSFQFSFQSISFTEQVATLSSKNDLKWDGIRKQKCAARIFHFALERKWISNETLAGNNLLEFLEHERCSYQTDYTIKNGRFVKINNLKPAKDEKNFYLKNYVRIKLYNCQDRPVIISAIFRKAWEKHVTFISVKPYIPNTKVITICDHINLFRPDVEKVFDINLLQQGKRYYIIGYCQPYKFDDRMGVKLAIDEDFCPIFGIDEYEKMPKNISSRCHRFELEDYLSKLQIELKL